jgi:hypothetical protein
MRYRLQTTQDSGQALLLTGTKHQRRNPLRLWSDLTTLQVEGSRHRRSPRISPPGVLKLAGSIRGAAFTRTKRAAAAARFLTYFTWSALQGMTLELVVGPQAVITQPSPWLITGSPRDGAGGHPLPSRLAPAPSMTISSRAGPSPGAYDPPSRSRPPSLPVPASTPPGTRTCSYLFERRPRRARARPRSPQ